MSAPRGTSWHRVVERALPAGYRVQPHGRHWAIFAPSGEPVRSPDGRVLTVAGTPSDRSRGLKNCLAQFERAVATSTGAR